MTIKTSSAKAKGRRLQQWVCERISTLTGLEWGPDHDIDSRGMGQNGVDIRLTPKARKRFPWSIECKNTENWGVPAAIKQAKENQLDGTNWLVVLSKNRHKPVVVMDAEAFFKLVEAASAGPYGPGGKR